MRERTVPAARGGHGLAIALGPTTLRPKTLRPIRLGPAGRFPPTGMLRGALVPGGLGTDGSLLTSERFRGNVRRPLRARRIRRSPIMGHATAIHGADGAFT